MTKIVAGTLFLKSVSSNEIVEVVDDDDDNECSNKR